MLSNKIGPCVRARSSEGRREALRFLPRFGSRSWASRRACTVPAVTSLSTLDLWGKENKSCLNWRFINMNIIIETFYSHFQTCTSLHNFGVNFTGLRSDYKLFPQESKTAVWLGRTSLPFTKTHSAQVRIWYCHKVKYTKILNRIL